MDKKENQITLENLLISPINYATTPSAVNDFNQNYAMLQEYINGNYGQVPLYLITGLPYNVENHITGTIESHSGMTFAGPVNTNLVTYRIWQYTVAGCSKEEARSEVLNDYNSLEDGQAQLDKEKSARLVFMEIEKVVVDVNSIRQQYVDHLRSPGKERFSVTKMVERVVLHEAGHVIYNMVNGLNDRDPDDLSLTVEASEFQEKAVQRFVSAMEKASNDEAKQKALDELINSKYVSSDEDED